MMILHILRKFDYKINGKYPPEYYDDFKRERLITNLHREGYLCIILGTLNMLLFGYELMNRNLWPNTNALRNLLYLRCITIVFHSVCLYIIYIIFKKKLISKPVASFVHNFFIAVTLLWAVALAINAQYIHGQISAYIIALFCLTTIVYLSMKERIILIGLSYIMFIIGLNTVEITRLQLHGHLINASFLVVLAFYVSIVVHKQFFDNYIKAIKIQNDADLLNELNENLESKIKNRTKLLKKRHETEIQFLMAQKLHDKRKLELEKTIENEKIKTMFLANVSHELRTPLNIIFSAQKMMDDELKEHYNGEITEKLAKYSRMIKQNSYRLIRLIGNLMDITSIDAGHYKINKKNIDIVKLIEEISMSFTDYTCNSNIKVFFESDLSSTIIACDPDQIERVMLNLLSNATKFLPKEGIISIKVFKRNNRIVISITDNGIGIPKDMHKAIFEKFVQVDKTTMRNHEGSGIGLTLVKMIIDMHEGRVHVKSKLGEGSSFFVELPFERLLEEKQEDLNKSEIVVSRVEKIKMEFSDIYLK